MLTHMRARARNFDGTKCFSFFIEDAELLEKYNKIWDKVSNSDKKVFNNKPIANEKYLKPYEGKINTIFMVREYLKKVLIAFIHQNCSFWKL